MKMLKRLLRSPAGIAGLALTVLLVLTGVFADVLAPFPFDKMSALVLKPPGEGGLFGTDQFGRDLLSRTFYGIRLSLQVAAASAGTAAVIGTLLGVTAGYFGGWYDALVMRVMEIIMAFPTLLLAIGIMAMLGSSMLNLTMAIAVVYLPVFARVARAPVIVLKQEDMVVGAQALGAGTGRVLLRHIVPNMLSPIIVQVSLAISNAVLTEAALSYLGLGVAPPQPSLGGLIHEAQALMLMAPWLAIFPGVAIMVMIFAFNLLGDTVRDQLDPRLRRLVGS